MKVKKMKVYKELVFEIEGGYRKWFPSAEQMAVGGQLRLANHGSNACDVRDRRGFKRVVRAEPIPHQCDRLREGKPCPPCTMGIEAFNHGVKVATEYEVAVPSLYDEELDLSLPGLYVQKRWDVEKNMWVLKIGMSKKAVGTRKQDGAIFVAAMPLFSERHDIELCEDRLLDFLRSRGAHPIIGKETFAWSDAHQLIGSIIQLPPWCVDPAAASGLLTQSSGR